MKTLPDTADSSCSCAEIYTAAPNTHKVCFVCTGNTCRSPMAAAAYNHIIADEASRAVSCGLYPMPYSSITPNAISALAAAGIEHTPSNPYKEHSAVAATTELLSSCDMIVGMTPAHTLELIGRFPHLAQRIFSMPGQISDPWGGDEEQYKRCLEDIINGIKELFHIE